MVSRSDDAGFRSEESRRRYLAVYERVRSLSPKPDVVHDLPTQFGVVRAYQHGPDGGIPMVLLHCFWGTSAMWADHLAALVGDFTVYTIDMLGGLGPRDVHLVGHSYAGGPRCRPRHGPPVGWPR